MQEHPLDPQIRESWKLIPIRIQGPSTSRCCQSPTLLVQSMEGGFVTQNCSSCGNYVTLSAHEFLSQLDLWVACPRCKRRMRAGTVLKSNYGYSCADCDIAIKLASILPRWEDI
jgi:hypothetical protein